MSTPNLVTCPCQHCNGNIQFDAAERTDENMRIACPHCGMETTLFIPPKQGQSKAAGAATTLLHGKQQSLKIAGIASGIAKIGIAIIILGVLLIGYGVFKKSSDERFLIWVMDRDVKQGNEAFAKLDEQNRKSPGSVTAKDWDKLTGDREENAHMEKYISDGIRPRFYLIESSGGSGVIIGTLFILAAQLWHLRAGQERIAELLESQKQTQHP
jgi:hypothetical protein